MERPWFQFYPGDWLHNPELRMCSLAARGLWIDMLSYMHQGSPYGYLKVGDKVILPPNLARMVGATLTEVEGLLKELEDAGAFSRDDTGCIFSRRMVRDEKIRQARAAGGVKGGNPRLVNAEKVRGKVEGKVGDKVNLPPNLRPTPSESESMSDSESDIKTNNHAHEKKSRKRRSTTVPDYTTEFQQFWEAYPPERHELKSDAFACWNARLAEGAAPEDLIKAATHYAAERKGEDPKFTMQPTTFLGPKERWVKYKNVRLQAQRTSNRYRDPAAEGLKFLPDSPWAQQIQKAQEVPVDE